MQILRPGTGLTNASAYAINRPRGFLQMFNPGGPTNVQICFGASCFKRTKSLRHSIFHNLPVH